MTIWGWKIHNASPPTVLICSEPNFMINKLVIKEYKVTNVLAIRKKKKKMWHFET